MVVFHFQYTVFTFLTAILFSYYATNFTNKGIVKDTIYERLTHTSINTYLPNTGKALREGRDVKFINP